MNCGASSQNEASLYILVSVVGLYTLVKRCKILKPVETTVTRNFGTGIPIPIPGTNYVRPFCKTHAFHILIVECIDYSANNAYYANEAGIF